LEIGISHIDEMIASKYAARTDFVLHENAEDLASCSPPRIGYATMSPNCSIGRLQGASFPSETCVRASL